MWLDVVHHCAANISNMFVHRMKTGNGEPGIRTSTSGTAVIATCRQWPQLEGGRVTWMEAFALTFETNMTQEGPFESISFLWFDVGWLDASPRFQAMDFGDQLILEATRMGGLTRQATKGINNKVSF